MRASQHDRQERAGAQERREGQGATTGRAPVPHDQQRPERSGENESEEERLRREPGEPEDEEERQLDVAHAERGGPAEAEGKYERDQAEAGEEALGVNPLGREQASAGKRCWNDDPVGNAVLGEVDRRNGTERGAEDEEARQLRSPGVEANARREEDKRPDGCRSGFSLRCHGARGSAVAVAFTVRVGRPTRRRSRVGISRSTSTLTVEGLALACARSSGSVARTASAVACASLGSSASRPEWSCSRSRAWLPERAAPSARETSSRRSMKARPMSTAAPITRTVPIAPKSGMLASATSERTRARRTVPRPNSPSSVSWSGSPVWVRARATARCAASSAAVAEGDWTAARTASRAACSAASRPCSTRANKGTRKSSGIRTPARSSSPEMSAWPLSARRRKKIPLMAPPPRPGSARGGGWRSRARPAGGAEARRAAAPRPRR